MKKESLGISNDLIFTSMAGDFMPKKTIQDWFKRFLVRKDLKLITFHGLHHTSATTLLASGYTSKKCCRTFGSF
ncbi:tyrosine-type recombinase/integrase [Tissierella sp. DSM 105185]|uniref:Tyrosine-type recombinase/integrase n=1 Tax=Tissierella pigra TaxID=2607614 RepID=A0A6N7XLH5_9FIRM|nr:tyrosine-type recombinase/integrase [Tissierella pigra]